MSDPDDWPVQDPGDEPPPGAAIGGTDDDQDDEPVRRDTGDRDRLGDQQL
ncbi:MAG TPA: hypothetical protein VH912_24145 [Streptosporangiaceae bacterium]|jgi:hypothetical protein